METINQKVISETKALVTEAENLIKDFRVNSQPTLVRANDYLVQITQAEKRVVEREREILDPLNKAKKSLIDFFRPAKERLITIKSQLKADMIRYVAEMEKIEIQKKAEIEKKVESGEIDIDKAVEKIEKVEEKKGVIITRTNKVIKIIDRAKVPGKYWEINNVLLRRDALFGIEIPGVEIVEEKIIIGKR